ncbi:preprotein translocase subunit SecG [bacterium]|nr:preprotein translocase subunit SecG [bacterium]
MFTFISIIHVVACVSLILIVLLQVGKGADIASMFGGAGTQSLLGTSSETFMTKLTTVMAIIFILTSISLSFMWVSNYSGTSIIKKEGIKQIEAETVKEEAPDKETTR